MRIRLVLKTGLLAGALLLTPLFQIHAQPSETTKSVLREVVEIKDTGVDSVKEREAALIKILELSISEVSDLIKQLADLKNLDSDYIKLRNQFLVNLGSYLEYFTSLSASIEEEANLENIKNLANDFKIWRENYYNAELKKIINYLLTFQEKATLETANARLNKITNDLNKVKTSKLIKTEQLKLLLNEAADFLKTARLLNDQAQVLLIAKNSNQTEIQDLIKDSFTGIKATYKNFFKMSALLKEMLGLISPPPSAPWRP